MSAEAPQGPPAAGGRAPSFGAPTRKETWTFTLGGTIYAWQTVGLGATPDTPAPNQVSSPLHVPALSEGKTAYGNNAGGSLNLQYGNATISGTVNAAFNTSGKEYQGWYNPTSGPQLGQAYLTINPQPLGALQLQFQVGGFTKNYAGPGQWGWGLYGPLLATRGYGFAGTAQYSLNESTLLSFEVGFQGVPGVPEDFVRGTTTGWLQTGISSIVMHAHAGVTFENRWTARLHYARNIGYDEREYIVVDARDGSIDNFILETRYVDSPFGQLGLSLGLWDLENANHVHNGIWWALDWTQGGSDIVSSYVGPGLLPTGYCDPPEDPATMMPLAEERELCAAQAQQYFDADGNPLTGTPVTQPNGDGKLFAISAEYDTSIAAQLWSPRPFNGQAPDLRLAVAGVYHKTLQTDDPGFKGADGYLFGLELDYQMLSWFSATLRSYAEDRDFQYGRYQAYSISPGIAFRQTWQSANRIELIYSRRFYSDDVDDNTARPLDPHVLALGAYVSW